MEWTKAFSVAIIGVVSVFLALGVLSLAVGLSGYLFRRGAANRRAEKPETALKCRVAHQETS